MRKLALSIFALIITFGSPASANYMVDDAAIEASRAGISARKSSPLIVALKTTPEGKLQEDDMMADREKCVAQESVLNEADRLFHQQKRKLSEDTIRELVADAGMPPFCVMKLFDSADPDHFYVVLISPNDDYVFGYHKKAAYSSWIRVDQHQFDSIELDEGFTTLGIAPAGIPDSGTTGSIK